MQVQDVNVHELKPAQYNPRQMTEKQHDDLKQSLELFGFVDPIIANKDKTVIGGHQRLKIAIELGMETAPVVYVDLPKDKERELNIRLNKNNGAWDFDALANEFDVSDLIDWGFDEKDLIPDFNEPEQKEEKKCPNCGYSINRKLDKV